MRPGAPIFAASWLLGAAACGDAPPAGGDAPIAAAAQPIDPEEVRGVRMLLARGLGEAALRRARQLQAGHPRAADAHLLAGDALGISGDFAGAAREYRKAADLAFTEPHVLRLVEALRRSGQDAAAKEMLTRFVGQQPDAIEAMALAAAGHVQAGEWPQAIRMYERIRSRTGDTDPILLNNLAWAYLEQGDHDRALPVAEAAWRLDKASPATADTLGWSLFKSGRDRRRGLVLLEQAAQAAPGDPLIRAHLEAARRG